MARKTLQGEGFRAAGQWLVTAVLAMAPAGAFGQMIDKTQAPNAANDGINKSLADQVGAGRGNSMTPDSASFLISRDPFRSIRRGRQIFQRKFTRLEQQGPGVQDGIGDIDTVITIGAGLSDSCASCHGRPRGAGGTGGDVVTRPDSRDAPHLFGLGLKEMLADEITGRLRQVRAGAVAAARSRGRSVTKKLAAKGIDYGSITASPNGSVDTSQVEGVDPDLRVRPFFAHGGTISIREFVVGALHGEMGLDAADPDLARASAKGQVVTPAGMVLDGTLDHIEAPPVPNPGFDPDGNVAGNEVPAALVDYLEFYLLNYFKPATYKQSQMTAMGNRTFREIGCASCHVPDLPIDRDRRVADVETVYDPQRGIFNNLFATATPLFDSVADGSSYPPLKKPRYPAISRQEHLHRLQAPRSRSQLLRAQLGRHPAEAVPHPAPLGSRQQGRIRARRAKHQPQRGHPSARGRGSGGAGCLRGSRRRKAAGDPGVPQHARAVSAGRHRLESRPRRPACAVLPAVRPRQHQADRPVQRSDEQGVNGREVLAGGSEP